MRKGQRIADYQRRGNSGPKRPFVMARSCGHTEVLWWDLVPTAYLRSVVAAFPCAQCQAPHAEREGS